MPELMVYMDSKFLFGETCCIFLQHFGLDSALHHIIYGCQNGVPLGTKKRRFVFSLPRRGMLLGYYTYMRVFRTA